MWTPCKLIRSAPFQGQMLRRGGGDGRHAFADRLRRPARNKPAAIRIMSALPWRERAPIASGALLAAVRVHCGGKVPPAAHAASESASGTWPAAPGRGWDASSCCSRGRCLCGARLKLKLPPSDSMPAARMQRKRDPMVWWRDRLKDFGRAGDRAGSADDQSCRPRGFSTAKNLKGAVYIEASLRYMGHTNSWTENVCAPWHLRPKADGGAAEPPISVCLPFGKRVKIDELCVPPPLVGVAP